MNKIKIIAALLLIAPIVAFIVTGVSKSANADQTPVRILTLCDSISAAGQYQVEISRILTLEGVPHQFFNASVGGTGVEYWAVNTTAAMNTYEPDLVLLNCGTNDTWTVANNVTSFEEKYRTVVEAILNWRTPNRVKLGVAFIQYGTPPADQTFLNRQPSVNDAIYRQLGYYGNLITGIADFQRIPPNALYQDHTGYHPTPRGYKAMGRIWYDAVRAGMGWPVASEPPICGMDGAPQITGYARRTPLPCEGQ